MSDSEILTLLKQNNPFISPASPLPEGNSNPDLLQLSSEASENIEQLIRHKRREPNLPLAGLILGEQGTGKTNMLARILRKLRNNARPIIFINVRAFKNPKTAVQHLLNEIFISLRQPHSENRIQFDVLMNEFMNAYIENRRNDGFDNIENIDKKSYIARDIPQIDRKFLKGLIAYVNSNDFAVKDEILEWFLNGLDDEDSHELGLPIRNLDDMDYVQREQEAEKVLIFLGHVLAYAKVTMIICFDELDLMQEKDKDLILSWGNIISFLVNNLFGVLPLCFIKPVTWNNFFVPVLQPSIVDRFSKNTMIMETCSIKQAQKLIFLKIQSVIKNEKNAEEVYKWFLERMQKTNNILSEGLSPRRVIELANHAITGEISIDDQIKSVYEEEYKKVQAIPVAWPPNSDQLALALEMWLKSHEGFDFYKSDIKNMRLTGIYKGELKFAFITVTSKTHFPATAGANHGIDFMNENPNGFACYITENKTHKKTWKIANETLKKFENSGGHVIFLDNNSRIKWYALTALINRIDNGDVNLYSSSGNRTATRNDIKNFVKNIKLIDFPFENFTKKPDAVIIPPKSQPVLPDDKIIDELKIIIATSPMNIISISKAIELLSQKNFHVEQAKILALIQSNKNIFKTFNSKNEILLTLTNRK